MTMKLEQVRDKLRRYAKDADNYFNRTRETLELTSAELLADAIDAHLLSQDAEIADLIGKRDFLLRHYNLAESRLAAANERLEAAERDASPGRCKACGRATRVVCDGLDGNGLGCTNAPSIDIAATQEGE